LSIAKDNFCPVLSIAKDNFQTVLSIAKDNFQTVLSIAKDDLQPVLSIAKDKYAAKVHKFTLSTNTHKRKINSKKEKTPRIKTNSTTKAPLKETNSTTKKHPTQQKKNNSPSKLEGAGVCMSKQTTITKKINPYYL